MAIIDKFKAEVIVDGQPAAEYDDDESDPKKPTHLTKYVEASSGKSFKLKITVTPDYKFRGEDSINIRLHIDGRSMGGGTLLMKERFNHRFGISKTIDGYYVGRGDGAKYLKFSFADLTTREMERSDDTAAIKEKYENLGTITIRLHRVAVLGQDLDLDRGERSVPPTLEAVPEKALKGRALDVATKFTATSVRDPGRVHIRKLDTHPMAKFEFKYRSKKALQSLMIIDRSPSPQVLEERPIEELSVEELRERLRRQEVNQFVKREVKRVKRERAQSNAIPVRPLKTSKGSNGETVYHLDSDDDAGEETVVRASTGMKAAAAAAAKGDESQVDDDVEIVTL